MTFEEQLDRARNTDGYLAALDQSGGSTPKALGAYGVPAGDYVEGEESMYEAVHAMRTRIITSPAFTARQAELCPICRWDPLTLSSMLRPTT